MDELIKFYQNLLIIQYHDKPNAKSVVEAHTKAITPVNSVTGNILWDDIRDGFDLDTAVGIQLDIIGVYIGVDRFYKGQIYDSMFALDSYTSSPIGNPKGFDFYTSDVSGNTLTYKDVLNGSGINKLDDESYRKLLKLKSMLNSSDGSRYSIDTILFHIFLDDVYIFKEDVMSITYKIPKLLTAFITSVIMKDILPKPMGVELLYTTVVDSYFVDDENNNIVDDNDDYLIFEEI